jgi:hypothetical protein
VGRERASPVVRRIPSLVLLFSPSHTHESDAVGHGIGAKANGGKSKCRTSTTLLAEDKGGVLPTSREGVGAGRGEGVAEYRSAHLGGLPTEGVVPERPVAPHQVAGIAPCVGPIHANGAPAEAWGAVSSHLLSVERWHLRPAEAARRLYGQGTPPAAPAQRGITGFTPVVADAHLRTAYPHLAAYGQGQNQGTRTFRRTAFGPHRSGIESRG